MIAPPRIWWKPLDRMERSWVTIALVWCVFMTAMMIVWFYVGRQNVPTATLRTTPELFQNQVMAFTEQYQVGEEKGVPIVEPPAGDIYLWGRQWQWFPILKLKKGETYRLHLSSLDVLHGFSLQPTNLNLMVLPDYEYIATITPTESGEFSIVCNEYCLIGHHLMLGKIIVE